MTDLATTPGRPRCARAAADGELLRVEDVKVHFPIKDGIIIERHVGDVRAVDGVSFAMRRGETLGLVGRVGLRQDDHRAGDHPPVQADDRPHRVRRRRYRGPRGQGPQDHAAAHADGLPGPVCQPQSADERRRDHRRAVGDPRDRDRGGASRARPRDARDRRPQPRLRGPLPARVLRWPAPAHRRGPGPGAAARPDRGRRADQCPRRLDPGPDHQPARAAPGRVRPDLSLRRPRPLGRGPHLRPHRGHVPRSHRRADHVPRADATAPASVLGRAALGRARAGPGRRGSTTSDHPQGRRAVPGRTAVRLPVPHALLAARADGQPRGLRDGRSRCSARWRPATRSPATSPRRSRARPSRSRPPGVSRRPCPDQVAAPADAAASIPPSCLPPTPPSSRRAEVAADPARGGRLCSRR